MLPQTHVVLFRGASRSVSTFFFPVLRESVDTHLFLCVCAFCFLSRLSLTICSHTHFPLRLFLLVVCGFSALLLFDEKINRHCWCVSHCVCMRACRSPRSPGRGGLLCPRSPRMLSVMPGVCLPKRYSNPSVPCVCLLHISTFL